MSVILAAVLALGLVPAVRQPHPAPPAPVEAPGNCAVIVAELARQGATPAVASRFGAIAWRESGCYPRQVHDSDDWSYSRFGLNGLTAGLRAGWRRLCDADVRWDTRVLSVDVKCALAAFAELGWRPWSL